jgi:hypothetical protein
LKKRILQSIELREERLLGSVKGCIRLDKISNHDIRSGLGTYKLAEKIKTSKTNWLQHLERMENYRLLKCILHYEPIRRRAWKDLGRDGKTCEPEQT